MGVKQEVNLLISSITARGYDVVHKKNTHFNVYKDGKIVCDPSNGAPISIPTSPSDWRWKQNLYASLYRAGVLIRNGARSNHYSQSNTLSRRRS